MERLRKSSQLRIPLSLEIGTLNPFLHRIPSERQVLSLVYDTLTKISPNWSVQPWLAVSWEVSSNGLIWTFHLVRDAEWHDGKKLTAYDVEFTFNYICKWRFWELGTAVNSVQKAEAVNDYCVKIHTKEPFAAFLSYVTSNLPGIVPKHIWNDDARISNPNSFKNLESWGWIGSGPFMLKDWKPGVGVRLEANERYFKGVPLAESIDMPIIPEDEKMVQSLKSGTIDILTPSIAPSWGNIAPSVVSSLSGDSNINLIWTPDIEAFYVCFNLRRYPFNIKDFRRAIAHSVDPNKIDTILEGYTLPGNQGFVPPALEFWYNSNVSKYEFDLKRARNILDSLGWIDNDGDGIRETEKGSKLEFKLFTPEYDPLKLRIADAIIEDLKEIGIKVVNEPLDMDPLSSSARLGTFDMFMLGWRLEPDPEFLYTLFHSSRISPAGFNYPGYNNPECNELLELQRKQFDVQERRKSIFRLQQILSEDVPYCVLYYKKKAFACRIDGFANWVNVPGLGPNNFWSYIAEREQAEKS